MRPQCLGRPDRLFNRAAWHLAVSKRERLALGRFATRCLRNAGGGAVIAWNVGHESREALPNRLEAGSEVLPVAELACPRIKLTGL